MEMRLFPFASLLLATLAASVTAAVQERAPAAPTVPSVPGCGLKCILENTVKSTCEPTNVTCICTDVPLNHDIAICVKANCTIREQLATVKYSKDTCGVVPRDRSAPVWIVPVVFGSLAIIAYIMRVAARWCVGAHSWGLDDWAISATMVFVIPFSALGIPLSMRGLGKDMWNVPHDDITTILYIYYWDEIIYFPAIALTKISILLFYLKVFPRLEVRRACYVLIGLNVAYAVAFEVVSIFQCTPVPGAWLAWDGEFKATCRNVNAQGWTSAAFNIVLDLATIILPLPEVYKLSLSTRKKVQILFMFSLGFFVTIVSIIRLQSLVKFANTENVTQDYTEIGVWTTTEVPVGVICACLPAIRSLLSNLFPRLFGTTRRDRSSYIKSSDAPLSKPYSFPRGDAPNIHVRQEWSVDSIKKGDKPTLTELNHIPSQTTNGFIPENWPLGPGG